MPIEFPIPSWKDYELLDSGDGVKLERFGRFVLSRPEPKALWAKSLSQREWDRLAHVRFRPGAGFGKAGKEDSGTWERLRAMDDQWFIRYRGAAPGLEFSLRLGLTAFKHVGVFPEQAANWEYIYRSAEALGSNLTSGEGAEQAVLRREHSRRDLSLLPEQHAASATQPAASASASQPATPRVLNLFAYTGAASLAARKAGADVTHLDSVRQVVTWANGNMERSGLQGIHWVVEDAMKFATREARRGRLYQGIILDPPAYGHGPDGEKWKLDECLFDMLRTVSSLLDRSSGSFLVLNLYSNGYSPLLGETTLREAFRIPKGAPGVEIQSGELALTDRFGKDLPLSIYVRLKFL